MVEPGRIKSSTKGKHLEDVTEDKEGERRLEEEEAFFDENEEVLKAPSQLGEEQVLSINYVFDRITYISNPLQHTTAMGVGWGGDLNKNF